MQQTIDETNHRRIKQLQWNENHNITPKSVFKSREQIEAQTQVAASRKSKSVTYQEPERPDIAADPVVAYMKSDQLKKLLAETKKRMEHAAKELDFYEAARLRDEMFEIEKLIQSHSV